ncbi:haloacid dehalogenase [Actinotignum sanguinis]|uniref:HAD-IA family hydrolase n=2 Tax=Actinotignum sanguinis TaxID=1445614 RepID=UPI000F7DB1D3|nr:HAD-IA family hydrolase [Actinotignum sanguinis]MDE1553474.1 HAD-IA family hydrolase [Actinotignum sanguinis]MDE1566494.1 HAD-IA family hydrolase [Actinotignum sanguinis]MDE1577783.1 HAD-IA family hydrolase [Actinotignum sanguinis]MDE1643172.1 HAD-IA family hydrolase [Actinotignum sanguinis]MDY5147778.1 HAD-IA family hydrolase [Actinotignum sanguinis]
MFHNIIWDMGGTMVDTYPHVDATLQAVVLDSGQEVSLLEVARLTRRSTNLAITELSRRFGIPEARFREREQELKDSWKITPPPAMAHVHDVLAAVAGINGINVVVTHRDRASARTLLEGLGLQVSDMVCPEDGFPRKPDPAMFTHMINKHHLDPARTLAIGDRPIDITTAHKVGVAGALLETPGIELEADADYRITDLAEVLPLLGS